jgi:hypothetical protein
MHANICRPCGICRISSSDWLAHLLFELLLHFLNTPNALVDFEVVVLGQFGDHLVEEPVVENAFGNIF